MRRLAPIAAAAALAAWCQAPRYASIAGVVLDDATGTPLIRAIVTLQTKAERPSSAVAWTGSRGEFSFSRVPPGGYYLFAARSGYQGARYGAAAPDRPPEVLTLAPGETRRSIVLRLRRLASISGVVLDSGGDPLPGVNIKVLAAGFFRRKPRYLPAGWAMTDDRGVYRAFGIAPGKYVVQAVPPLWRFAEFTGSSAAGGRPKYGMQFYSGADSISSAATVTLAPGKDLEGVDFQLPQWRTASLKAKVLVPPDIAPGASVQVSIIGETAGLTPDFNWSGAANAPDYMFEAKDLVPGSYTVVAFVTAGGRQYRGERRIELDQDSEVEIPLQPGVDVSGSVRLEGAAGPPPKFRVYLVPGGNLMFNVQRPEAETAADGAFHIHDVVSGIWDIGVEPIPKGGYIKSMRLGSQDVLTEEMSIGPSTSDPLNIVVSARGAAVDGTVTEGGEDGKPGKAYVLLAPEGKFDAVWSFYRIAAADQSGHFEMKGLTPGAYKLYAFDRIDGDPSQNPDFLNPYHELGQPVELTEGGRVSVTLRLIGAGR